ncbi:MAG: bifunctional 4-hydroxy-2-oxoglutarate aldolase/2-dehydro-3-deoxy-phosphogluconate aldolase [Pseudomonadota bacterium]
MSWEHDIEAVAKLAPVIPVLVVDDVAHAAPLAEALVAGGLRALEVTLRTPVALDVIRAMRAAAPEAVVGAGTLLSARDVEAAIEAGVAFGVSPGAPAPVLAAAKSAGLPMLPGVATPTEALTALEAGFSFQKFFPAEANGGIATLKAWASPLAPIRFCPTGGVTVESAPNYLALPNVVCVGGSWIAPPDLLKAGAFDEIARRAGAAAAL